MADGVLMAVWLVRLPVQDAREDDRQRHAESSDTSLGLSGVTTEASDESIGPQAAAGTTGVLL